jgi:acetyl esterase/lipase
VERRGVRLAVGVAAVFVVAGFLFHFMRSDPQARVIPGDLKSFKADRVREAVKAFDDVEIQKDVQYGDAGGEPLLLDVYLPADRTSPQPAIILLHGGGWHSGNKSELAKEGAQLARLGWVAFSLDYRLDPFPAAANDVVTAVRWIRSNALQYGVDPAKIGILGSSAGGNLGAFVGMRGSGPRDVGDRVAVVASWSGPMDLRIPPGATATKIRSVIHYLGCLPTACPARYAQASPITAVDKTDAPLLIVNGTQEIVPLPQAQSMANRLKKAHVPYKLIVVQGHRHARGYRKFVWAPTLRFLEKYLGRLPVQDFSPPRSVRSR